MLNPIGALRAGREVCRDLIGQWRCGQPDRS
jgi:hypothetical protein